jgi:hypothetical protein
MGKQFWTAFLLSLQVFLMMSYWQVVQLPPVPGNLVERTYIASLTPGVEYAIFIQV